MASRPGLWTVIQSTLLSALVWSPAVSLRLPTDTSAEDYGLPPCMAERLQSTQMTTFGDDDSQHLHDLGLGNIYVLHYKKLSERRQLAEEQLRAKNLSAKFVTGWDGEELGDDDLECMYPRNGVFDQLARDFKFASSWFHIGELSLSVKHVAAAYDTVRRGYNNVLILEDDFVLTDNFTAGLSALLSPHQWEGNRTFDIMWLGSYNKNRDTDLSRGTQIVRDQAHKGTIGYVLSNRGARHILAHMPVTAPSDHMLGNDQCGTAPPQRWSHRPWLVEPRSLPGTAHTTLATPKRSHYIRTPDLEACAGTKCPCRVYNVSLRIVQHDCCCSSPSSSSP